MKFKFDSRTGMMVPEKDENIYFAKAMSGGLRIDDNKNNVKYVIERNGKITNISGVMKDLHFYDRRDANIIAERVKRMFGPKHEYANYRKFMKGLHESIVKNFNDFVEDK